MCIPYITINMHQIEEDVSMINPFYDSKIRVRDPGQQNQRARPVQKLRV